MSPSLSSQVPGAVLLVHGSAKVAVSCCSFCGAHPTWALLKLSILVSKEGLGSTLSRMPPRPPAPIWMLLENKSLRLLSFQLLE